MKNNINIKLMLLIIILVLVSAILIFSTINNPKKDNMGFDINSPMETFVTFTSDEGELALYNLNDTKIAELDLKNHIDKSLAVKKLTSPPTKPKDVESNPDLIEGKFVKVDIVIEKGDYVWKIQRGLTPHENIARIVNQYLRHYNDVLHPIYKDDVITFLKYYDSNEKDEDDFQEDEYEEDYDYLFRYYKTDDTLYAVEFATGTMFVIDPFNLSILNQSQVNTPLLDSFVIEKGKVIGAKDNSIYIDGKVFKSFEDDVLDWEFLNDKFYVTIGDDNIYIVSEDKSVKVINPKEKTVMITQKSGLVYALNNFGKGLEKNVLFEIDDEKIIGWYELEDESYMVKDNPFMVIKENVLYLYSPQSYKASPSGHVFDEVLNKDVKYSGELIFAYDSESIEVIHFNNRNKKTVTLPNRLDNFKVFEREKPSQ